MYCTQFLPQALHLSNRPEGTGKPPARAAPKPASLTRPRPAPGKPAGRELFAVTVAGSIVDAGGLPGAPV